MACDTEAALENAACFVCLDEHQLLATAAFNAASAAGLSTDPAILMVQAECFMCMDEHQLLAIAANLACGIEQDITTNICVSGSGQFDVNATYVTNGFIDGKVAYLASSGSSIEWDSASGNWFIFSIIVGPAYNAHEDVATPDLVSSWNQIAAPGPSPTVTIC